MRSRLLLFGLGMCLIVVAGWARFARPRPQAPGKLVAESHELKWRESSPLEGRPRRKAAVQFRVINVGRAPVRVLSVESGCGCATPTVRPDIIAPGKEGIVDVLGTPLPVGERTVTIVLHTDSPVTPSVPLHLHMLSSQKAPFVIAASGALSYLPGFSTEEIREVVVWTVERDEEDERPMLKSGLPFLQFEPISVDEKPSAEPGTVRRTYKFRVSFASMPPDGTFTGEVEVIVPWDGRPSKRIPVQGQVSPPVRVIPTSLSLHIDDPVNREALARFSIITKAPATGFEIEVERGEESPLLVEPQGPTPTERFATFAVRWKPDRPIAEGVHRLVIRPSPETLDRVVVPVAVTIGGE